ncbi:hypothetical protein HDU85_005240 [Gaertneriomyces sp. JEL0708]|nr:hypothetical protein HDU85_005240 [Gaertneriomyces sp. JEL0708]
MTSVVTDLKEELKGRTDKLRENLREKMGEHDIHPKSDQAITPSQCKDACRVLKDLFAFSLLGPLADKSSKPDEEEFSFKVNSKGDIEMQGDPWRALARPFLASVEDMMDPVKSQVQASCEAACMDGNLAFPNRIAQCLAESTSVEDARECIPDMSRFMEYLSITDKIRSVEEHIDQL